MPEEQGGTPDSALEKLENKRHNLNPAEDKPSLLKIDEIEQQTQQEKGFGSDGRERSEMVKDDRVQQEEVKADVVPSSSEACSAKNGSQMSRTVLQEPPTSGSKKAELYESANMEKTRKLEIRLSRLPDGGGETTTGAAGPSNEASRSSFSPEQLKTPTSSPASKRASSKVAVVVQEKTSPSQSHQQSPKARRTLSMKRKRHAANSRVKIKMNFLTRKLAKRTEAAAIMQKSKKEIDFETKERDAAAEATKKMLESRASFEKAELLRREEERMKRSMRPRRENIRVDTSSPSDDTSEDEYDYRPMRAAAAAALEAVVSSKKKMDSDSESWKSFRGGKYSFLCKLPPPKGKGRRSIMKRALVQKGIRHYNDDFGFQMCKSLFHEDVYFQIGDIVSVHSQKKNDTQSYYGQISYLMKRKEKDFVEIVWLTPNKPCLELPFDPRNYNRRDDFPPMTMIIDCCEFVMHCPSDYYTNRQGFCHQGLLRGAVYQRLNQKIVVEDEIIPKSENKEEAQCGKEVKQEEDLNPKSAEEITSN